MFTMEAEQVSALRMQSRSYACLQIKRRVGAAPQPVGVLLVESVRPRGITPTHLDQIEGHVNLRLMSTECEGFLRWESLCHAD
ncbi:hypothetical protein [Klugiella xanthotipulae]|uniref:Uncharacterized protein n=1 Tax=Klugiella xanthotipulae TaxID=244735 RepID=A0A543I678_9MICO|nr:hypothetical protein [Klugiella xanthotipulae]TQM66078.1 hypothetical protein FB466_0900 [Klugiella xanthotipulae]